METIQKGLRRQEFKCSWVHQICRPLELFNAIYCDNEARLRSLQSLPTKQREDSSKRQM